MTSTTSWGCRAAALALAMCACSLASAQTLVSRASHIVYNAVYGGGPDVWTPSDDVMDGTLLSGDDEFLHYSDSQAGFILDNPERPWSAEVSITAEHAYEVAGPLKDFSRIDATGSTIGTADSSGEGLANLISSNPGNQLALYFDLSAPQPVRLQGLTEQVADGFGAADVLLQRFDGFSWGIVFWSAFLPGSYGAFDASYDLPAGEYRIIASASINVFSSVRPEHDSRFTYRLTIGACYGDLDGDHDVDIADLATMLSNYGVGTTLGEGDLDSDGDVDIVDLSSLLSVYGTPC